MDISIDTSMSKIILDDKIVRKLHKNTNYSYSVVLPKEIVKRFGWREKQKLELEIDTRGKKIIIKDYKSKK